MTRHLREDGTWGTVAAGTDVSGLAAIATSGSATDLASGTVPTARLGSGTANNTTYLRGDQTWATPATSGGGVPIGTVVFADLSAGDIATYFTAGLGNAGGRWENWALCNGSNGTRNLASQFVRASTTAAGGTGGSDSSAHTHAIDHDHASATTGAESGHTHSVTSNVAVADHSDHTHSVTSNVAVANHASHTHTYTQVVNHTHGFTNLRGLTTGSATTNMAVTESADTSSTATTLTTANPSGGVATGTTNGPDATQTHSVTNNAVTSGSPSVALTHSVTNNAVTSGASSGHTHSLDLPNHTGTSGAASATDNRPAYVELVPVMKVA